MRKKFIRFKTYSRSNYFAKINIIFSDIDEYEAIESLNHVISTLEKENKSLKNEVSQLNEQLEKEQQKSRELIPQYKASVARLKKNTQLIRDKLKDIQEIRIKEKREFEDKVTSFR